MSVPFATRNPDAGEVERLRLVLSTFRDGSGMVANGDETYPGWRDFERSVAAVLGGSAPEAKGVFDVTVPSTESAGVDYGFSIKSKALTAKGGLTNLATDGRVYMELANSPAKFLIELGKISFKEGDFTKKKRAQEVGEVVLRTVTKWHEESVSLHAKVFNRILDLEASKFLVLSYCLPKGGRKSEYQWHSFSLKFPDGIVWKYPTKRCLRGYDPAHPKESLFDFYPLSGGQLKSYPRASNSDFSSPIFDLASPAKLSATLRAARMYPREWIAAGGSAEFTAIQVRQELENLLHLSADDRVAQILREAQSKLGTLAP